MRAQARMEFLAAGPPNRLKFKKNLVLNVFYALTRRMPLLKIMSICRTKRYSTVAESMGDLKVKGMSNKYLIILYYSVEFY